MRIIMHPLLKNKKILLIDRSAKDKNDRTWCFWEKENGFFNDIVHHQWKKLNFLSDHLSTVLHISPYNYKMIRGIEFYDYCYDKLKSSGRVDILYGEIEGLTSHSKGKTLLLNGNRYDFNEHTQVFSSIYKPTERSNTIRLLQHFKGWVIETPEPVFDPLLATFMDFRVDQQHGTAFAYVLPLSGRRALVEYTLFTEKLLDTLEYETQLRNYIKDFLKIYEYRIIETEFGIIPMTNEKFNFYKEGIFYIGTAGGQTKASSGYTFQFIQKQSEQIADHLANNWPLLSIKRMKKRYRFYDNIFLRILQRRSVPGPEIFSRLFRNNTPQRVFRFLDNESSLSDDLKIISCLPTFPFFKAALQVINR